MSRRKRMKASDVFREADYAFHSGPTLSFEEAFPGIEEVLIEVDEIGDGVDRDSGRRQYTKNTFCEYINCSNPVCYKGGFSIGTILRHMVATRQSDFETTKGCQGYEGSPKGRRYYRPCSNGFKIRVHIDYKEPADDHDGDHNAST
jgi:hypothetical protein